MATRDDLMPWILDALRAAGGVPPCWMSASISGCTTSSIFAAPESFLYLAIWCPLGCDQASQGSQASVQRPGRSVAACV